jgi:hypothetical protein
MSNPINAAILDYARRICEPGRIELVTYPGGGEVKDLSLALLDAVEKIGEGKRLLQDRTEYAVKFARHIDEQYGVNEDEADAESGYPGGKICYSCGVSTTDGEAIHDGGCIIPEVARFLAIAKEASK